MQNERRSGRREAIFVRGRGLFVAEVDNFRGVAVDPEGERYVRLEDRKKGVRWFAEKDFLEQIETPEVIEIPKKTSELEVDYGIRDDDPLKDFIHQFVFNNDDVLQYQVNPQTNYIGLFKVGERKAVDMITGDQIRYRPPRSRSFKRRAST